MKLKEHLEFFERLAGLIRRRSTGNADEFSSKLDTSPRSVHRLIKEMKDEDFPIEYCKHNDSYIFTEPVSFEFRITVGDQDLIKIKGGYKPTIDLIGFENL